MRIRKVVRLVSVVAAVSVASWPVAAHADSSASARLCADPSHECTVTVFGDEAGEAVVQKVMVTGAPGTSLRVAAYYARTDDHGKLIKLERFAVDDAPVVVGETGVVGTGFSFPSTQGAPKEYPSAWIFVGPDDVTMDNLDKAAGTFVPYGTLKPTVLGDGWGLEKPVGQTIGVRTVGSLLTGMYRIEYQDDAGHWVNVTKAKKNPSPKSFCGDINDHEAIARFDAPHSAQVCMADPSEPVDIGYQLPRGMRQRRYKMRLTSYGGHGLIVVHRWDAVPSDHPKRAPYKGTFREPAHRGAPSLAGADERHPSSHVMQGTVGGGVVALALAMAGARWRGRRS